VALRRGDAEIILLMLKCGSKFPADFTTAEKERLAGESDDFRHLIEDIDELHRLVEVIDENVDFQLLVRHVSDRNCFNQLTPDIKRFYLLGLRCSHLKFCFNIHNESLAHRALKLKKLEVFNFIRSHLGLTFHPDEPRAIDLCRRITNINFSQAKKLSDHHLHVLLTNSRVNDSSHDPDPMQNSTLKIVFDHLNGIDETREILKIVAAHEKFRLVFDTTRNDVTGVQVDGSKATLGVVFWTTGNMAIGAKDLFSTEAMEKIGTKNFDVKIARIIGTLQHELCHYAMLLVFRNACNPFGLGGGRRFMGILEMMRERAMQFRDDSDELRVIGSIFKVYHESQWAAELVVRPAQVYAEFKHKPEELRKFRGEFLELFEYFEGPLMRKMRSSFGIVEKMAMDEVEIGIDDLTDDLKMGVKNSVVTFQGFAMKIADLTGNNLDILKFLGSSQIRTIFGYKEKVMVGRDVPAPSDYINRGFTTKSGNRITLDGAIKHARNSKILVIHEGVGVGKTTTLDFAAWLVKMKNPHKWILKVDKKDEINLKDVESLQHFTNNVMKMLENSFEAKILENLMTLGRVVIFWDHFEMKELKGIVHKIQNETNCEQWLSTWDYDAIDGVFDKRNVLEFTEMSEDDERQLECVRERKARNDFS
jgi:hypothetical protein